MAALPTTQMIEELRRKIAEPTTATYADADLRETIERYPLMDSASRDPSDDDWVGTWDLNRAAGDIWEEKAGKVAVNFDFSADGGDYTRSQVFDQMMQMARSYRGRRASTSVTVVSRPLPDFLVTDIGFIGNLPEENV